MAAENVRKSLLTSAVPMFGTFLVGILLAVGHHVFYVHLAGTDAPTGSYQIVGNNVPKQRFNTTVGTTFAFLVKAALAVAVWNAYSQLFWRSVRSNTQGERLSALDTLFSIPHDLLSLVKVRVWFKYPTLLLLALVAWLIPLAAIITPATLSVQNSAIRTNSLHNVPKFDFTNFNFIAPPTLSGHTTTNRLTTAGFYSYWYRGPSRIVDRLSSAVAAQGEILDIKPPALNASWTVDFYGPQLRCNNVSEEQRSKIINNIWEYYKIPGHCASSWSYMAWIPQDDRYVPFTMASHSTNVTGNATTVFNKPSSRLDIALSFGRPTSLMIAVIPGMFAGSVQMATHLFPGGCAYIDLGHSIFTTELFNGSTFLKCEVFNTSMTAEFEYVDGEQKVNLTSRPKPDDETLAPVEYVTGPVNPTNGGADPMVGWAEEKNASCSTLNTSGKQCKFEPELLRVLSYQGIVNAFNNQVQGTIGLNTAAISPGLDLQTNLLDTVLQYSKELEFLQGLNVVPGLSYIPSLTDLLLSSNGSQYKGLYVNSTTVYPISLATALQQLFQNLTISLLSDKYLQPDPDSEFAPSLETQVAIIRDHNVYIYARRTLWLAYGIAIAFTLLCVCTGTVALVRNRASFNNDFSTIVRVGRTAMLSEEVTESDGDGTAPLPKHLSDSRFIMKRPEDRQFRSKLAVAKTEGGTTQKWFLLSPGEVASRQGS